MNEGEVNIFNKYSYNPYSSNTFFIDDIVPSSKYIDLFEDLKKSILNINRRITEDFFNTDFNFPSKDFIILESHHLAFNLYLKAITLKKIKLDNPGKKLIIDVFKEEIDNNFFENRFLNQYALIAKQIGEPFYINKKVKKETKYVHDPSVVNKILSILNFKNEIISHEFSKRIIKKKKSKKILKIGQNDISREIEAKLYKRGIDVLSIKKELVQVFNSENIGKKLNRNSQFNSILKIASQELKAMSKTTLNDKSIFEAYVFLISKIFNNYVFRLLSKKKIMREKVSKYKKHITNNICISNGIFGLVGKSIYDALCYNNIHVISAEHGLTAGNSKDSIEYYYANESLSSDTLFCYSNASRKTHMNNRNSNLELKVVGAHSFSKKIRFKSLQKFFNKKRLNLKNKNIFFISHNIELNIGKYFPYTKSNPNLFKDELNILSTLGKINKNFIYKPYPTKQYLFDRSKYVKNYINKYKNINYFEGEEDFRYVRTVADVIITQSSESTLEWCIGSNVPLIFLDSNHYEPLENNKVKKAFEESFFVFNYDDFGWENKLTSFLNLPYDIITKKWNEKKIYRKKYDEEYFLSINKDAGEIGSKFILDFIYGKN